MRLRLVFAAFAALAASACSHMPRVGDLMPQPTRPVATPDLAPRERVRVAIEMLGEGRAAQAEVELRAALEEQPGLTTATRLLDQIEREPRELLAGNAQAYTVRQGETMSALAERFQGDALLFYALARFNNLEAPNQVTAGQSLMIPRRPGLTVQASIPSAPRAETPMPTPPALRGGGADPAQASALRREALQHLNAGRVDRAVSLLRQAQGLDAGNAAIQRDLDRALRLQASLRTSGGGAP